MPIEAGTDPEITIIDADADISDDAIEALAELLLTAVDGDGGEE